MRRERRDDTSRRQMAEAALRITCGSCASWDAASREEARAFIKGNRGMGPLNAIWNAARPLATVLRCNERLEAIAIGRFDKQRKRSIGFSIYNVTARTGGCGFGEAVVRRLEAGALEWCETHGVDQLVMRLPDGQCHRSTAALLMYVRCGWSVSRRRPGTYNQYTEVTEAQLKELLASGREEIEEAQAAHPGRMATELRKVQRWARDAEGRARVKWGLGDMADRSR